MVVDDTPTATRRFDRVADLPAEDWDRLATTCGHPFLDRRYLSVLERSLAPAVTFRWLLLDDADGRPLARAGLSVLEVDLANLTPERMRGFLGNYRRVRPSALRYNVVLCGLPISNGRDALAVAPDADPVDVAETLDREATRFAREHRGRLVVFKEFGDEDVSRLEPLTTRGYSLVDSLPLHVLPVEQATFDAYVASRSKRMRRNVRDYFRSGESAGLEFEHRRGGEGVPELFTDELHQLYLDVFDKATLQFEQLPRAFFVELAREFPEESRFTFVRHEGRIVAFVAGLRTPPLHTLLKVGYDTSFPAEAKLYFNAMYRAIEHAFEEPVETISVGQGADEFKRRLGCVAEPRRFYLKVPGLLFGTVAKWLVPRMFPERY